MARLLHEAKYVLALVGAGMSVESGIPPFRGPGGLWAKYGEPDMRGYDRFLADPKGWWESILKREGYASELVEGIERAKPNPGHYALAELEEMGILKYIITQNVDNLHYAAGSKNVAEIHGNSSCDATHATTALTKVKSVWKCSHPSVPIVEGL